MNREEVLEVIKKALEREMIIAQAKMIEHPVLGYGRWHDRLYEAKQYLEKNLK